MKHEVENEDLRKLTICSGHSQTIQTLTQKNICSVHLFSRNKKSLIETFAVGKKQVVLKQVTIWFRKMSKVKIVNAFCVFEIFSIPTERTNLSFLSSNILIKLLKAFA